MKIGIDARFYGGVLERALGEYRNILMHIRIQKRCLSDDRFYNDA